MTHSSDFTQPYQIIVGPPEACLLATATPRDWLTMIHQYKLLGLSHKAIKHYGIFS